jgi:hypothetical protein
MLLVILGSLAIPAITNAFASVRLRRAGDAIISRWAEARAQAIETGQIYQFRFTPDTGRYRLEPWVASTVGATSGTATTTAAAAPSGPGVAVMPGAMPGATAATNAAAEAQTLGEQAAAAEQLDEYAARAASQSLEESPTIETVLPAPVKFYGGQAAADDPVSGELQVTSLEATGETWSTPILFFPDGSTSTATIVLQNEVPQSVRLTLRGLTGVARASGVMSQSELTESSRVQ